jgi:hypothetical protein
MKVVSSLVNISTLFTTEGLTYVVAGECVSCVIGVDVSIDMRVSLLLRFPENVCCRRVVAGDSAAEGTWVDGSLSPVACEVE